MRSPFLPFAVFNTSQLHGTNTSPPAPELTLTFAALGYAPDTYALTGVQTGTGILIESAVTEIRVLDNSPTYQTVAAETPAYVGARHSGGVQYADNGSAVLLDPQPYALVAPAATNLLPNSSDLTQWEATFHATCTTTEVHATAAAGARFPSARTAQIGALPAADTYCYSSIAKLGKVGYRLYLRIAETTTLPSATYNLSDGTYNLIAGDTCSTTALADGYYRCAFTDVMGAPDLTGRVDLGVAQFLGSGVVNDPDGSEYVISIHAQIERNSAPTYPIVTGGAAATRDARALSFDPANFDDAAGSLYCEVVLISDCNIISTFLAFATGNIILTDGENSALLAAEAGARQLGMVWDATAGTMKLCVDGSWSDSTTYNGTLLSGAFDIFRSSPVDGKMRNLKMWNLSSEDAVDAEMAA